MTQHVCSEDGFDPFICRAIECLKHAITSPKHFYAVPAIVTIDLP